ncbi:MAG TPA: ferritin-like domain-containing protein [Chloroflexota bacterium]|nr:ferritin-like domain-containing protein [Chloroflexota bacterium]
MAIPSASPLKVTTRVELIQLLVHAAEMEHALMCQYLFTAFTMKQAGDEGITADQARLIQGWYGTIMRIAVQEMRHLAQACNLLTAVGGAPFLRRAGFPRYASYYTLGLESELTAFSVDTIHRYGCWEKPDWVDDSSCSEPRQMGGASSAAAAYCAHLAQVTDLIPGERPYHSMGELYALIGTAFDAIPARELFIGPSNAQITNKHVPFREPLVAIATPADAHRAIHLIVVEGEGTPQATAEAHTEPSHYESFLQILAALKGELDGDPRFAPARPVIDNPVFAFSHEVDAVVPGAHVVTNSMARKVGAIFTAAYDLTLQLLMRFFTHTDETGAQQQILVDASLSLMAGAIRPLGCLLTRLPAGDPATIDYPGLNAGPSFEVYSQIQPVPHVQTAWRYFQERLWQLTADCQNLSLSTDAPAAVAASLQSELTQVAALLQFWSATFVAHGPATPETRGK